MSKRVSEETDSVVKRRPQSEPALENTGEWSAQYNRNKSDPKFFLKLPGNVVYYRVLSRQ